MIFTYRYKLYALDRKTGKPIPTFGDSGWVDLRAGLGRPTEQQSVSASTPGVVFEDLLIIGSTVSETLPGSPGDIRAYDIKTGALRWSFHTIPHPGEFGYETWPPDAWKVTGGANAWAGVTVDPKRAIVFAATGSASFDFYGANRVGDDLFANTVLALDARTGKRIWHFQGLHHDLWDRDFPAAPALVTVTRDGRRVDAVAQITKTGHVYVFDRETGKPLFPIENRKMPAASLDGERTSETQPFPVLPPPFTRQRLTEDMLTTRTPEAHAAVLETFRKYKTDDPFDPPSLEGRIMFPGVDGGGEWGGPAFDPETGLLYVNSNEMPWLLKMVPRNDKSLYGSNCASCHGDDLKGSATMPSLVDIGSRRTREQLAQTIRAGHWPHARLHRHARQHRRQRSRQLPADRQRRRRDGDDESQLPQVSQHGARHLPRSRRLSGDHAAVGHAQRDRSQQGRHPLVDSVRRVSEARGAGTHEHRHRQLRRRDRDVERSADHRRDDVRQEVPRLRQAAPASCSGKRRCRRPATRRRRRTW